MFQGHSTSTLDEKGRIIIPSRFRKHISSEANDLMYVTLGRDKCLWLYPSYEWFKLVKTLERLNSFTKDVIDMRRQLLYPAEECPIDSQHRILISQELLDKAEIKKEALLIGQLERIELWNKDTYENYLKSNGSTYEEVMEKVMSRFNTDNM